MPDEKPPTIKESTIKSDPQLKLTIDLWATDAHSAEVGIHKMDLKAQKDRQWTKDSDIIGILKKDGEDYGHLVIRQSIWDTDDPLEKRLVLKLFSMSDYWQGSLELLKSESLAISNTIESVCPSFTCVQSDSSTVIRIRKLLRRSRLRGEVFSIDLIDEEGNSQNFIVDDQRLSLGSDWEILNAQHNPIGKIDGKFLNIGGKFEIKIYDTVWAAYKPFYVMLGLFAAMLRYKEEIYDSIEKSLEKVKQGETVHLEDTEVKLYQNPRLMRY